MFRQVHFAAPPKCIKDYADMYLLVHKEQHWHGPNAQTKWAEVHDIKLHLQIP